MPPAIFRFDEPSQARGTRGLLPPLAGRPIRIHAVAGLRDGRNAVHAGSFVRQRRIAFDCVPAEFPRIFVHEVFHFVWVRVGNQRRWSFERLLTAELGEGARGELGWSAEWRKEALTAAEVRSRGRRWREYCCESFCDTAAWLYGGVRRHREFTLGLDAREARKIWFRRNLGSGPLPV